MYNRCINSMGYFMANSTQISALRQPVTDIMWECGNILLSNFGHSLQVEYKDCKKSDPVTEIDRQLQNTIIKSLGTLTPDYNVLGEEEQLEEDNQKPSDYLWVIDPLDGTTNYINNVPIFGSSIGLMYKGSIVAGWIYIPWPNKDNGLVISGISNEGCHVNQSPVHNEPVKETEGSKLIGLPGFFLSTHKFTGSMAQKFGEPRGTGSIAYECCLCAIGSTQYSIFGAPKLWDIAGGIAIVKEAGGESVTKPSGSRSWSPTEPLITDWDPKPESIQELKKWSNSVIVCKSGLANYITSHMSPQKQVMKRIGKLFT